MLAAGFFQEITGGTCGQRVENVVGVFINGEDDEMFSREQRLRTVRRIECRVDVGQIDVHQDDVRFFHWQLQQRAGGVAVFAEAMEPLGLVDPTSENLPRRRIILNYGNANIQNGLVVFNTVCLRVKSWVLTTSEG